MVYLFLRTRIFCFAIWNAYTVKQKFLCVGGAFWPVFIVANVAALIASRAMTTATFSCIKQSTALGCFPRLKIIHTSRKFMGQIYIPVINWFLLAVCLVFVCCITSVDEIGNAYGNNSSLPFYPHYYCKFCFSFSIHFCCVVEFWALFSL